MYINRFFDRFITMEIQLL